VRKYRLYVEIVKRKSMLEKVKEAFEKYPTLRVLFYFDGDGSHAEDLQSWNEGTADIALLMGSDRYFSLKHQLHYDLKDKRVFLYFPFAKPKGEAWEDFPLRSLFHANRELKLDDVAEFMAQYKLPLHARELVKRYYDVELKKKGTQIALTNILNEKSFNKENLEQGLIAVALGFVREANRTQCLAKLLALGAQEGKMDRPLSKIKELGLLDELRHWVDMTFETHPTDIDETVVQSLACRLKYNLLIGNVLTHESDTYASRLRMTHATQLNRLLAFYEEWQNDRLLADELPTVLTELGKDVDELKLVEWYGAAHEFGYFTPRMIGELLNRAKEELTYNPSKVRDDIATLRSRVKEDKNLNDYFDLLENAAILFDLLKQNNNRYVYNTADIYIEKYTGELWKIDYHYRKAVYAFNKLENTEGVNAFDFFNVKDLLNDQYDRYLIELNREWLDILKENNFNWHNLKAEKQYAFYDTHIRPLTGKIAVIISDAFRFEAAHDLFKLLQRDSKNEVEITSMLASLPSITKVGMSNLLPRYAGVESQYNDTDNTLKISIGNVSTEGLANRRTILKQVVEQNEALSDEDLLKMNEDGGRAFFNLQNEGESKVVYIYHNEIDNVGDDIKSENRTFEAVENTVLHLHKLLKKLNNLNIYQIWITADHGFIFNDRALKEADIEDAPKDLGEVHSRFILGKKGAINVSNTTDLKTNLRLTLPNTINRFKKQGSGKQYVHGGASLQELIVPVIKYSRSRIDKALTVKVRLMNEDSLKIQAGALKLQFLQEQAIGNQLKPSRWAVGLYDHSGIKRLSTEEEDILFDSDSASPTGRMKTLILRLNTEGSRSNFTYLYIYDLVNDKNRLNPKVKKRIDFDNFMEQDEF
jgi:uncharacterized protein (TIGR02687 family)